MKKCFYLILYTFLIGAVSLGVVSCKKDDPVPEIVTNPLDEEAYYLIGKVTSKSVALADVTVAIPGGETKTTGDGTFQLKVSGKGDYKVSFTKTGYITVSSVATVASDAKKSSSVALTQQLVQTNPAVTVSPDAEATITDANNPNLSVVFPAGAVKTATPISITAFNEGAKKSAQGASRASLATINCEPDGLTFDKPVTVFLKAPEGGKARFSNLRHYIEKNGEWADSGEARYDAEKGSYAIDLMGFSNHSVSFTATQQFTSTTSEPLSVVEIDNIGTMTAKSQDVSASQKFGWEIAGTLSALVQSALPDLNDSEVSSFASSISSSIASLKGSSAGVAETTLSLGSASVSGDTKLTITFTSKVLNSNFTFSVAYNNAQKQIVIPVKTYLGTNTEMAYTFGESRTNHSGGSGQ